MAHNIRRFREARRLGYTELSRMLSDLGWEIAPLGLRRIEQEARRVDTDDLVRSPSRFMSRRWRCCCPQPTGRSRPKPPTAVGRIWMWAQGVLPLSGDPITFKRDSNPFTWAEWEKRYLEETGSPPGDQFVTPKRFDIEEAIADGDDREVPN